MKGDSLCGYYGILSQLYLNKIWWLFTCSYSNNEQATIDANTLNESVVKPYLESFKSNWKGKDDGETFNNELNGWLSSERIQAISNECNRIIILIYLESEIVEMFIPCVSNNLFIREEELTSLTFKQLLENDN
jgi:hypothetical protein